MHSSEYTALQLDDVNFIASMTKLMTSVAVMQCVERGLVGLDDGWYPPSRLPHGLRIYHLPIDSLTSVPGANHISPPDVSKIVPRLTGRGIAIEVGDGVEVKKSSTRLTLRFVPP